MAIQYLQSGFYVILVKTSQYENLTCQNIALVFGIILNKLLNTKTDRLLNSISTCMKRSEKLANAMYVLLKLKLLLTLSIHVIIILGFISIMNVMYVDRTIEYMYIRYHDHLSEHVDVQNVAWKRMFFSEKANAIFKLLMTESNYSLYISIFIGHFLKNVKNGYFFTHNKTCCPMQNLTALTTWFQVSGSRGQTEMTFRRKITTSGSKVKASNAKFFTVCNQKMDFSAQKTSFFNKIRRSHRNTYIRDTYYRGKISFEGDSRKEIKQRVYENYNMTNIHHDHGYMYTMTDG